MCDIIGIAAETVCFVMFESCESSESFEYSFETQMLVQGLTQRTQVQMLMGKIMQVRMVRA